MGEALEILGLALRIALTAVLLAAPPALAAALALERLRGPWALLLQTLVLLPLVLPPVVTGYLLLGLFGRSSPLGRFFEGLLGLPLAFSFAAAVIAAAVVGFPLFVESLRLSLRAIDPRLIEVSRCLGRGPWATLWRVQLPLAWPGLLAGGLLAFARALGEFGATIVLAGNIPGETRQIPLAVYSLLSQPGREREALALSLASVGLSVATLALLFALRGWHAQRLARLERGPP